MKSDTHTQAAKKPFDIHKVMAEIRQAVEPFPKAALFELADEGFTTPFEQLLACIISIRTRDETMIHCAHRLFELARTPKEITTLSIEHIDKAITPCMYHFSKAGQIHAIAQQVVDKFGGSLPCDFQTLTSFHGVGPKCANLVLGIACGESRIGVDIHVHRITNRWGYVYAKTPEKTMDALQRELPKKYFLEINRLLVPFGKHICTGTLPKCSQCPVLDMCQQVGVTEHR